MNKQFASVADLEEKKTTFVQLSEHCWGYTAEGDPNTGVIIADDSVLIVDTLATPVMAARLIAEIRRLTDKPIKYVVLSHYHAVRVLGASAYRAEGLQEIIASQGTYEMIVERGAQDMQSEYERFPRLFQDFDSIPGLTWPTLVFQDTIRLNMGGLEVQVMHPGAGHTRGDTVVWVPAEKVLFSGDLVECDAACYTGDAQLAEWPTTLATIRGFGAEKLLPGRGPALTTPAEVARGLDYTTDFVTTLFSCAQQAVAAEMNLKQAMAHIRQAMDPKFAQVFIYEHCLPFDVVRAIDEAKGIRHPRIWTAARDQEMWHGLQPAD
ncbi:MAG: MBL fold metallo-hydrolase [Candidatus Accumulibacter meliphilus]|jgi:glyoxylase-like metal-dependent hydrolase (beta-lactamase superfamily II)|uniref:MBL fold metallo-hydrolase n=1 Tax=Candidatus Accumulibacter meliphilus TaxID=2211374 RepID=A0A369XS71_9PROT|nr:MAG: MBL fold metallo-hydrolase [Candidatus Accumulibacter meliphilus]